MEKLSRSLGKAVIMRERVGDICDDLPTVLR